MNTAKILEIKAFRGIKNVGDWVRMPPKNGMAYLTEGVNLDIDNDLMPHRRDGYGAKIYGGSRIHSFWSDGEKGLFVQDQDLRELTKYFTSVILHEDVGDSRMNYTKIKKEIVYTNGSVIAYLDDEGFPRTFPTPTQTFKTAMKAGHLIEYFGGRLYVARGDQVWFSDPMAWRQTDERKNFKQFRGYVNLLRKVKDGLFISDSEATYFMGGLNPQDSNLVKKANYPAILGTDAVIDGNFVGQGDTQGIVVIWLSKFGFCVGADGGQFSNATPDFYQARITHPGAAIVRKNNGYFQYLVSQKDSPDVTLNFTSTPLTSTGSMSFAIS